MLERKPAVPLRRTGAALLSAAGLLLAVGMLFALASCVTAPHEETPALSALNGLLTGETWILSGIAFQGVFLSIEPAHNAGNVLVFHTDGTFQTSSGYDVLEGTWRTEDTGSGTEAGVEFRPDPLQNSLNTDPEAARFQDAYRAGLSAAKTISAYGDQFFLYDAGGNPLLGFIRNNPDW